MVAYNLNAKPVSELTIAAVELNGVGLTLKHTGQKSRLLGKLIRSAQSA
jgi:hypothetical protein